MKMSSEAERLFWKIIAIGPSYFDVALPLHERQVELCDAIRQAKTDAEARQLAEELLVVGAQIDSIGETKQ
jgi:hypothetical protein